MKICVKIWPLWPLYMFLGRLEVIGRFKTRFTAHLALSVQVTGRNALQFQPELFALFWP